MNTDAHICLGIGQFGHALALLDEIHFPQELVATTNAETFLSAFDEANIH